MTPARFETIAFRMWQYAEPLGWDCTARDVADAIGVTYQSIGHVARMKGWTTKLRAHKQDRYHADANAYSRETAMTFAGIKQSAGLAE